MNLESFRDPASHSCLLLSLLQMTGSPLLSISKIQGLTGASSDIIPKLFPELLDAPFVLPHSLKESLLRLVRTVSSCQQWLPMSISFGALFCRKFQTSLGSSSVAYSCCIMLIEGLGFYLHLSPSSQLFMVTAIQALQSYLFNSCFYHIEVGRRGKSSLVCRSS